jgi:hypothetical protein
MLILNSTLLRAYALPLQQTDAGQQSCWCAKLVPPKLTVLRRPLREQLSLHDSRAECTGNAVLCLA